jgi:hypothetical protein
MNKRCDFWAFAICVSLVSSALAAEMIDGKIVKIDEGTVTVKIDPKHVPNRSDKVQIGLPGRDFFDAIALGTVREVNGELVVVKIFSTIDKIEKFHVARITSEGPSRRGQTQSAAAGKSTANEDSGVTYNNLKGGDGSGILPASSRPARLKRLERIHKALWDYIGRYNGNLPSDICRDGKPILSWRVALLPFDAESSRLFQDFHLDEPWDGPHNKTLLNRMPSLYQLPGAKPQQPHATHYLAFCGPEAAFDIHKKVNLTNLNLTDGMSNTLMVIETADAVPWTKPGDLEYHPDLRLPRLGNVDPGGFMGLFVNGDVHLLPTNLPENDLRAIITPNGHEARPAFLDTSYVDAAPEQQNVDGAPSRAASFPSSGPLKSKQPKSKNPQAEPAAKNNDPTGTTDVEEPL